MAVPIRVLQVAKSLGLGGTEKVMQLFAAHLDRRDFQAAVHSPRDGPRGPLLRAAGIPTHVGTDLLKTLQAWKPDVVHLHRAGWPEPGLLRPLAVARVPVVVETNVFGRHDPSPSARILDRTLFVSRFCAERFAAHTGIPAQPPRYGVLYNPVDTDFFARACPPRDLTAPAVGRLSRPDPGKWSRLALDFLPPAAAALPGLRYRIVGGIPEAEKFVRAHGLEANAEFLPPLATDEELAGFFNSVSLLTHANDTGESFGLAIAEAMAAGLPVVTHPCPGPRDNAQLELVEHGVTGLVARDAREYAEAVIFLLTHPEEARNMGEAGRAKAARLFRAQDLAARLGGIYREILTAKGLDR
ncbi:glycosyltransferase family 4 protein [Desulfovibrio aminophilus]|nr:glycosyltransferase family 4 protein [Desulfovibrio aminophilus]MCM0753679.1 glycosyltransferase family 4 protein [Desulfovibrio aminophilus]